MVKVKGEMGDRSATEWDSPFTTLGDLRSRALAGPARRLRTLETSEIGVEKGKMINLHLSKSINNSINYYYYLHYINA